MSVARTERLLNLLTLLLNTRRPLALRQLREMEEFGAYSCGDPKSGERAFERDKAILVELGVPLRWISPESEDGYDSDDSVGGYVIDRHRYFLPELDLDPGDRALLSIAGSAAVALDEFPKKTALVRALAKLGFDVDEGNAPRTLAHVPVTGSRKLSASMLDTLQESVASRRRIRLHYEDRSGQPSERVVDPFGLYYRQGAWYLVGYCHLRQDERTFHAGRIQQIKWHRNEKSHDHSAPDFDIPADFDLSKRARIKPWEFPLQTPEVVYILLQPRLVPALQEIFGEPTHTQHTDSHSIITLTVSHPQALVETLLPLGRDAQVLSPSHLREQIGSIYRALANRYQEQTE
jgi:predicted DNA-binding transcriptional regulator YafY